MDILRKELNEIYAVQQLHREQLPQERVEECVRQASSYARLSGCCVVLTDAAADRSFFLPGNVGRLMALPQRELAYKELSSSDEDFLYERMHPADLADLRMLEYEFFKRVDNAPPDKKRDLQAYATVRMRTQGGNYVRINKGTRVAELSPWGKMWLILCTYDVVLHPDETANTRPLIVDNSTGELSLLSFADARAQILSDREKQVLGLIREGKQSKEIAAILRISPNTVSRHRQKILEKLSVGNSIEAVNAAVAMQLL